ncbi:MAG TPA: FeoA family protein [Anaerolineae bacterium]|nr:FeoA family protein [Anaerolineae bacterium]
MEQLTALLPMQRGAVQAVQGSAVLRKRLLDMGLVPGAEISVVRVAPLGDPVEYMVKGYRLSLRRSEAAHVLVERLPCEDCPELADCVCETQQASRCPRWLRWLYGGARGQ